MNIEINTARLIGELEALAQISEVDPPAITRVVYSDADRRARQWFDGLCKDAGLSVRNDAIGNFFVRWAGAEADLPAIGTGSHIDAIPYAGAYDGTVGVLGGLEAIRALKESGFKPRRSIELLLFTAEEPTRFGIGCFGSRILAGTLWPDADVRLKDADGASLNELRNAAGFTGSIEDVLLGKDHYAAFVELHIEQGPLLERERIAIGIVTNIAAPSTLRITFDGEGGHAGALLMTYRKDAFCAASEIVLAVEKAAKSTGAIDTCGTVGKCAIHPGAVNSVPSRVVMEVDVRDTSEARRDSVLQQIRAACKDAEERRGVKITVEVINADSPAEAAPEIIDAIAASAETIGLSYRKMVSRAYHDSLFMARVAPMGMIFIPCRDGVSHRPDEYSSPEAITAGVCVLALTLARLAE
jgi:N-carbamoyl-L-amino-acid hydrolase